MEIKLHADYRLTSDRYQYILQERKVPQKGENIGKEYWDNIGYYSKLQNALDDYVDMRVKLSDVKSITEIISHLKELKKEVKALVEVGILETN